MSEAPKHTKFVSRGSLNGVLRQHPAGGGPADTATTQPGREGHAVDELDTQAFEALYYRARLILGEPLARPGGSRGAAADPGEGHPGGGLVWSPL